MERKPIGGLAFRNHRDLYERFTRYSADITITLSHIGMFFLATPLISTHNPVGYSPEWLIVTFISLIFAGGLLFRRRMRRL